MEDTTSTALIKMLRVRIDSLKCKNIKQSDVDLIINFINKLESSNSLEDKEILDFIREILIEDGKSYITKNIMPIIALSIIFTLIVFIIIIAITGVSLTGGAGVAFLAISNITSVIIGFYFGKNNKNKNEPGTDD